LFFIFASNKEYHIKSTFVQVMLTYDTCHPIINLVIRNIIHKGLNRFDQTGDTRGITSQHINRLSSRLEAMNIAESLDELDRPGWKLHELKGDRKGTWSISVNGPWRLTFEWDAENKDCCNVDFEQYHDKKQRR
jgi:proteic killer suppression protein